MMSRADRLAEYKLVVIGGAGVGKSKLKGQFILGYFHEQYDPTLEGYYRKPCIIDDEVSILSVLDVADDGHGEHAAVQKQFIRAGQGFLLAYSIDSRDSFEEVNAFHHLIRSVKANENFPIVLTACKCDLEKDRQVGTNEGRDLAKHLGCMFFESSAKRSIQVEEAFTNLVREIRRFKKEKH